MSDSEQLCIEIHGPCYSIFMQLVHGKFTKHLLVHWWIPYNYGITKLGYVFSYLQRIKITSCFRVGLCVLWSDPLLQAWKVLTPHNETFLRYSTFTLIHLSTIPHHRRHMYGVSPTGNVKWLIPGLHPNEPLKAFIRASHYVALQLQLFSNTSGPNLGIAFRICKKNDIAC